MARPSTRTVAVALLRLRLPSVVIPLQPTHRCRKHSTKSPVIFAATRAITTATRTTPARFNTAARKISPLQSPMACRHMTISFRQTILMTQAGSYPTGMALQRQPRQCIRSSRNTRTASTLRQQTSEGYTLYLDDIAKFAYDTDMKKTGNDTSGVSYNDPAFPTQNMETSTVGFSTENQMLNDAAYYGHGKAFKATNAAQLTSSLQSAISDIITKTSSTASVALNTGSIGSAAGYTRTIQQRRLVGSIVVVSDQHRHNQSKLRGTIAERHWTRWV